MRYTLHSHGTLVGYTDLDVHCVQSHLLQGFVEPAPSGEPILITATRVPAVIAAARRSRRRLAKNELPPVDRDVIDAMRARDALDLELRSEQGVLTCDYIRIYDLRDESPLHDEDDDLFTPDDVLDFDPDGEEEDWEVDSGGWEPDSDDDDRPWIEQDERWETMRFLIQVVLRPPDWLDRRNW